MTQEKSFARAIPEPRTVSQHNRSATATPYVSAFEGFAFLAGRNPKLIIHLPELTEGS
jgi:hypothetical protein